MSDKDSMNGETNRSAGYSGISSAPSNKRITENNVPAEGESAENSERQQLMKHIKQLLTEKQSIDRTQFPTAYRLLDQELTKAQMTGHIAGKDPKYIDIYNDRAMKVAVKVAFPIKEFPKFNFVGKILGPKGHTIARLQEETMCKISVMGRGSMRDREKEDELRKTCDPKYAHLSDNLHVEVSAYASPAEAHARVSFGLAEVRKYLIPDNNDFISQEQFREIKEMGSLPQSTRPGGTAPPSRGGTLSSHGAPPHAHTRGPPHNMTSSKSNVLSILDRARVAMESNYGYDESIEDPNAMEYDYSQYDAYARPAPRATTGVHPTATRYAGASVPPQIPSNTRAPRTTVAAGGGGYYYPYAVENNTQPRYRNSPYTRPTK